MSLFKKILSTIQGLRKWSIMFLLVVIGVTFRITDLLTGVEFVALLKGTAIAFFSSNAVEHIKSAVVAKKKEDMSED